MELLDVFRVLRRRWLPALIAAVIVAAACWLVPDRILPLPKPTIVNEITMRFAVAKGTADGDLDAQLAAAKARIDATTTSDDTLNEARNRANLGRQYAQSGARALWRTPTTFDVTFTGPDIDNTLLFARYFGEVVVQRVTPLIPAGASIGVESTRNIVTGEGATPQDMRLGRQALSRPLGIALGVIVGIVVAFVANGLDRRIRGVQDLPVRGLTDRQVLGALTATQLAARMRARAGDGPVGLVAADAGDLTDVESALREAGVAIADGAPTLIVVRPGDDKRAARAAVDLAAETELAAIALVR